MADDDLAGEPLLHCFIAAVEEYAIVTLDRGGLVLSWNAGAERITGYRHAEIIGHPVEMFYTSEDVERGQPQSHLAHATALGQVRFEGWRVRADGSRFWGDVLVSAIYGPGHELCGFGEIVRDATQSRRFQRELMRQALHDSLTGLPNRALLLDRMRKALARLERHQGTVAVFFIDLDRFKTVNDSFGHQAGDRVLVEVAQRLRSVLRTQDTVARLSGDEFVVLCEVQLQGSLRAQEIAERLAASLARPILLGDEHVVLGAGIGVTVTECAAHEPERLLRQADIAMYEAKRGRSGQPVHVRFFDHHPGSSSAD